MKKTFITGLVILLPTVLTIAIVVIIFNLLTAPFTGIVQGVITRLHLSDKGFLFFNAHQMLFFISQIAILIFLFLFTLLIGYLARWIFVHSLFNIGEYLLERTPFISAIYKASKDLINTLFTSKSKAFKQVVLVPFPHAASLTIGFLANDSLTRLEGSAPTDLIAVFIPTTPIPTSGYLSMFSAKDVIYLDMKVEDAFKYIISCGVMAAPIQIKKEGPHHVV